MSIEYPGKFHYYFNSFPPALSKRSAQPYSVSWGQRNLSLLFSTGKKSWTREKMVVCFEPKRIKYHDRALKQ